MIGMKNGKQGEVSDALAGVAAEVNPLKSFTFLLALGVTVLAGWSWWNRSGEPRPPFPWYGTIAVSYAAGFMIGRLFWRVVKTAALVAAVVLGGLALLSRMHVDTSKARAEAKADAAWVRSEAKQAKHYLVHLLPSGAAAAVGVFAGGRRRGDGSKQPNTTNLET
jgi:hypothetical protein